MYKELEEMLIAHQFELPRRLTLLAYRFPHVEFYKALALYKLAVEETVLLFNAKNLYDEPLSFGRGLVQAQKLWLEKMERAEKINSQREKIEC